MIVISSPPSMSKKSSHIPVYAFPSGIREGIFVGRTSHNGSPGFEEVERSHRDGGYSFIIQEAGTTHLEIDFQKHAITAPAVIFLHPNQVHRVITFENATISSWIISIENIRPEYLQLLESLAPVKALPLDPTAFTIIRDTATACINLAERTEEPLYKALLKESCNTLLVLIASQYLAHTKPAEHYSRFEVVAKAFKAALESDFASVKAPSGYAAKLNISTPYLNECVKATTGHSVSHHIQQRVVLEAKRLLYHSDKSVKEIAGDLGYDDYSYFTRLFVKVAGVTPVAFRNKNLD